MKYVKEVLLLVLTALCVWAGFNAPSWYRMLSRTEETTETISVEAVELRLKEKEKADEAGSVWTEIRNSAAGEAAAVMSAESFLNEMDLNGAGMISMPLKKAMRNARAFLKQDGEEYSLYWQVTIEFPTRAEKAEIWTSDEGWILSYSLTGPEAPTAIDAPAEPEDMLPELDDFAMTFAAVCGRWAGEIAGSAVDFGKEKGLEYSASFTDTDAVLLIRIPYDGTGIDVRWSDAGLPESGPAGNTEHLDS